MFGAGVLLEMLQPASKRLSPLVQRVAAGGVWRAGSSEGLEIPFGAGDQARRLLAAWEQQGRAAGAAPGHLSIITSSCSTHELLLFYLFVVLDVFLGVRGKMGRVLVPGAALPPSSCEKNLNIFFQTGSSMKQLYL